MCRQNVYADMQYGEKLISKLGFEGSVRNDKFMAALIPIRPIKSVLPTRFGNCTIGLTNHPTIVSKDPYQVANICQQLRID